MTSHISIARAFFAALLAACALFAISAAAAFAANTVPPSTFEGGDGDLIINHGGTDWNSPAPNLAQATDNDGGPASAFVTGSKEQDPGNWDLGSASAPSKADILHAAYANEIVSGDLYFYGAFDRLDGSGNANVSFELNRLGGKFDNGNDQVPIRSEGDLLITFDGNNSGGVRVGMCIWHGDRDGESSAASGASNFGWYTLPGFGTGQKLKGSDNCTTLTTVNNATAAGSMNNGTVTNTGLSQFPASIADNRFGEMTVNVSAALRNSGIISPCVAFGSAWIHSRSSDAPLSSMQDYVDPTGITAATPCSIDLEKSVAVQRLGDPNPPSANDYADADAADSAVVANTGDTLHYLIVLTNPGQNAVTLGAGQPADDRCTLVLDSKKDSANVNDASPGTLDPGDVWTYSCTHVFGDPATDGNLYTNVASVVGAVGNPAGCTAASNPPCVHDSDPANVQRAATIEIEKINDGGPANDQFSFTPSADLSGSNFSLTGGQVQSYDHVVPNSGGGLTYTTTEGALAAGYRLVDLTCNDADSTADKATGTATFVVDSGETVRCTYTNRFTSPGIAIDKSGPANATAGDLLPYTLTVTNPGQESLAASTVVVTDQQCSTTPALQAKNTGGAPDATPDSLDPGDSWIYTCSGQTQAGQSSFDNTACVSGSDVFGRNVSACDSVTTVLAQPPVQVVAGERVEPGEARIAGATGCVARKFNVVVRGKQIQRVDFRIDGKKRASLSKPDSKGRFVFKVDPKKFKPGSHLLVAKSTFTAASNTKAKTMKLRFARCVRKTAPAFTG